MQILFKEFIRILALVLTMLAPGVVTLAQSPAVQNPPAQNPLADLPGLLRATPGVLGVETARTQSGKMVIFAWFENKKAALGWYYSDAHRMLMKMTGAPPRPHGPMADIADDGRPIMAIASITLPAGMTGPPAPGTLPAVPQIAIELYAPLPGGLAAGGRFAPSGVKVPGLREAPSAAPYVRK
jgi:hypothetical protein